ncbi:hypothetical protein AAEJ74_08625 [Limnospira fusiformis PMC 851.14]|uniref:Uncharacterized protein n=1 Tax=Limnospira fusiformis PMC 851.14 TaxID=2219512 RepID=A0ABU9EIJ7_LIMFS
MQQSAIEHTSQLYTPALSPPPVFVVRSHFTQFHQISTSNNAPNVGAGAAVSHGTHQPIIYTRPFPAAVLCGAIAFSANFTKFRPRITRPM